jgi:hypothetical protein
MWICKEENCNKQPNFNYTGETKGVYCHKHKIENMINVISNKCKEHDCNRQPLFNYTGETKGMYCSKHKIENMVNIVSNKCIETGCKIIANFNYIGETKRLYCSNHKLKDMIICSIKKKCLTYNCNTEPIFNYTGETKGIYCSKHKIENMVNVKDKMCIFNGCNTVPSFNYTGEIKSIYCSKHKIENMVNVKDKMCIFNGCNVRPNFNYKIEKKGIYCSEHKLENMVNVKDKMCKSVFCETYANKKYDNYCTHCFANLFPNDPRTPLIQKNSKEIKVVSYLTNEHSGWLHDKPLYVDLKGGCCDSKRRIDLRKMINGTLLCIEIDENQHKYYNKQDELDRYDNLFTDFSGKYIFIRYNPDKCNGKNPKFPTRMERLEEEIKKQTIRIEEDKNKELVEIVKLYYDKK